jgi:hypothetical protein
VRTEVTGCEVRIGRSSRLHAPQTGTISRSLDRTAAPGRTRQSAPILTAHDRSLWAQAGSRNLGYCCRRVSRGHCGFGQNTPCDSLACSRDDDQGSPQSMPGTQ